MDTVQPVITPNQKNSINLRKILNILIIVILFLTTITFAYLFVSKEPVDNTSGEIINSDDEQNTQEETEDVVECNYEEIQESVKKDPSRYHLLQYGIMFGNKTEKHVACNQYLKTKLYSILDSNSEKYEKDEIDRIKSEMDNNRIDYLIDNTFVVYSYGHLYEIDIEKETMNLMWGVESPVEIEDLNVYGEDSRSTLIFLTSDYGLGGDASETEAINKHIELLCNKDQLGIFMYSTETKKFNMISENEICK